LAPSGAPKRVVNHQEMDALKILTAIWYTTATIYLIQGEISLSREKKLNKERQIYLRQTKLSNQNKFQQN